MFQNYFKIAWRNIYKSRYYSAVTILGLSIGIVFTLMISAYVWSELQVNKHLKNADRQYLIQSKWKNPDEGNELTTFGPLARSLRESYPDLVANYYRFDAVTSTISKGEKAFREDLALGDSTLLNMFGFELLYGDKGTALNAPYKTVISEEKALKYFGKTDIIGQTITIQNFSGSKHDFIVSGVMQTPPQNSVTNLSQNISNNIFVSTANLDFFGRNMDWQNNSIIGFIELQPGVKPVDLKKPMSHLIRQNIAPQFKKEMQPYLIALNDFHLDKKGAMINKMIVALSAIAFFILMMSIINFINMSVSRSASRMREIGIRKVLGGLKRQLIFQFLIESVIIVFLATCVAFVFYALSKDLFGEILNKKIPSLTKFPAYFITYPILLILTIGILGGLYPAFILSSLRSVDSLKGKLSSIKEKVWLRKSMVAFQFGTAIIVLISAIIISEQIKLFTSQNLGYNKEYVLSAQLPRNWSGEGVKKMFTIRNQFASLPEVKKISISYEIPNGNNAGQAYVHKTGADESQSVPMQVLQSDENFLDVYQVPLAAGAFFKGNTLDSGKIILNETAIKDLGWRNPADAIGKTITIQDYPDTYVIQGITKDFHFGSMQQKIAPVIFINIKFTNIYRYISFKIVPGDIPGTINTLQKKWNEILPGEPFEYQFMDESIAQMYQSEMQLKKASYSATVLAIIIVLLGVLGLISLSIQKRTREIGIRKVLGSSVKGIIILFIKDFLGIILLGGIIASSIAYILMKRWLQEYAYRIDLTSMPFIVSIVCIALITTILICIQTIKTAIANPVKSLKSD